MSDALSAPADIPTASRTPSADDSRAHVPGMAVLLFVFVMALLALADGSLFATLAGGGFAALIGGGWLLARNGYLVLFKSGGLETDMPRAAGIVVCLALVALGDFFFYRNGYLAAGSTAALFAVSILAAIAILNPDVLKSKTAILVFLLTLGQCLALFEYPDILPMFLTLVGLITLVLLATGAPLARATQWIAASSNFVFQMPARCLSDFAKIFFAGSRVMIERSDAGRAVSFLAALAGWIVPVTLTVLFVYLFSLANPVISSFLSEFSLNSPHIDEARLLFWLILAGLTWPLLRARYSINEKPLSPATDLLRIGERAAILFPARSVVLSLVLFNALFAIHNLLDVAYLWGGAQLPDGVSHAEYAQNGAYALMGAALLAAVFVIAAFPDNRATAPSGTLLALLMVWIAQTVLLVVSAMQRLGLYIEQFSLTQFRLMALIWMGLVAFGLVLIVWRLLRQRSASWLISANVIAAMAVLYVCSFVDFQRIIADYNVRHSGEVNGTSRRLDIEYLISRGTSALPALDEVTASESFAGRDLALLKEAKSGLEMRLRSDIGRWDMWTWRNHRLAMELGLVPASRDSASSKVPALSDWPVVSAPKRYD